MQRTSVPVPADVSQSYRVVDIDANHVKATAFNMLFAVWRRRTVNAAYVRVMQHVRHLAPQFPEGVGVSQVVELDAEPPEGDVRRAFIESMKLAHVKHFSVIHDGAGFKAASVRGIMAGVQMLARPKFKIAVHSDVSAAARWHALAQEEIGRHETASQIEEILRSLRQLHKLRYPG